MLGIRLLTLFNQRLPNATSFLRLPRSHRSNENRRTLSVYITNRRLNLMRKRQTITRSTRISFRSIRRLQRFIGTMLTSRATCTNSTKVILCLSGHVLFFLNLLFGRVFFESSGVIQGRRNDLFFEDTNRIIRTSVKLLIHGLFFCLVLIRNIRLFRTLINVNMRKTRLRRIRCLMITTRALKLMGRSSLTFRTSNCNYHSRCKERRGRCNGNGGSIRSALPRERIRNIRCLAI